MLKDFYKLKQPIKLVNLKRTSQRQTYQRLGTMRFGVGGRPTGLTAAYFMAK